MVRKLLFYNAYITCNGEKTHNSICDFIDRIHELGALDRVKRLENGDYSSLNYIMPNREEDYIDNYSNRYISFGDYRERKPRLGRRGTDTADNIDRDVIELTTIGFINTYKLLLIEYNHYGARINQLKEYLDEFLPQGIEGQEWKVEITPVKTANSMERIRRTTNIKNVELTINLDNANAMNIINQMEDPELTCFQQLLSSTVRTNEFGFKTGKVFLSKGRRRGEIDTASIILLLETLDFNDDFYSSIKVEYANPDTNRMEKVDLKHEGIVSCNIMADDDNDGFEHIVDNIKSYFYDHDRPRARYHERYLQDVQTIALPE